MNRRDSSTRSQQPGGYQDEGRWDTPRQAGQWQDGPSRQAGGYRDSDDDDDSYSSTRPDTRQSGYGRSNLEGRYVPDPRGNESGSLSDRYGSDYRSDSRRGSNWGRRSGRDDQYPIPTYDASGGENFNSFTSEDYGGRDQYARGGGFAGGGLHPSDSYRPTFGFSRSNSSNSSSRDDYGDWREYGESRGFMKRAGDEIASWFGDEDAARRREMDHRGRGPSDYTRSDERIREDVNDSLTNDWRLDASRIRVTVSEGEVTLEGTVDNRSDKRRAEDLADQVSGARHVQNNLRVGQDTVGKNTLGQDTVGKNTVGQSASGQNTAGSTGSTLSGSDTTKI